jgi:capsid protein
MYRMSRKTKRNNGSTILQTNSDLKGSYSVLDFPSLNPANDRFIGAYYANASGSTGDVLADAGTRHSLLTQARFLETYNCWAKGIANILMNDTVGRGFKLSMSTDDEDINRDIENSWEQWVDDVCLWEKLQLAYKQKIVDGESFISIIANEKIVHPVKMDIKVLDCERITGNYQWLKGTSDPKELDGIEYDRYGNPKKYKVVNQSYGNISLSEYYTIDAGYMIHLFNPIRPGQHRGLTEFAPALDLFAKLDQYENNVVIASDYAARNVVYLKQNPNQLNLNATGFGIGEAFQQQSPGSVVSIGSMDAFQLKAEQPTTNYEMFTRMLLSKLGRCFLVPIGLILGDVSTYTYSSMTAEGQEYFTNNISIRRKYLQHEALDKILLRFLEYSGYYEAYTNPGVFKHRWYSTEREHNDPNKVASAIKQNLDSGITNYAKEYSKFGLAWKPEIDQRLEELAYIKKRCEELNITLGEFHGTYDTGIATGSDDSSNTDNGTEDGQSTKNSRSSSNGNTTRTTTNRRRRKVRS